MKLSSTLLLILAGSAVALQAQGPRVETRGDFLKIVEGEKRVGAPINRDAPEILYIRRSDIVRVAVVYSPARTEYRVLLVTTSPSFHSLGEEEYTAAKAFRTYIYSFGSLNTAADFSEVLVSDKPGKKPLEPAATAVLPPAGQEAHRP